MCKILQVESTKRKKKCGLLFLPFFSFFFRFFLSFFFFPFFKHWQQWWKIIFSILKIKEKKTVKINFYSKNTYFRIGIFPTFSAVELKKVKFCQQMLKKICGIVCLMLIAVFNNFDHGRFSPLLIGMVNKDQRLCSYLTATIFNQQLILYFPVYRSAPLNI